MSLFNTAAQGRPTRFGSIFAPDPAWLSGQSVEPALEPELEIVDAHHHLWDLPQSEYLVRQFAADIGDGHNVVATVFMECGAMYRAHGPVELRPVGETAFAAGMAAISDSGNYGPARVCAGIVGYADLRLGAAVEPVLHAHVGAGQGRFRGVRFASAWDASDQIGNSHPWCEPQQLLRPDVIDGLRVMAKLGLCFDAWVFHPQLADIAAVADAVPDLQIVLGHCGGPLGYGPYRDRPDEVFAHWRESMAALARRPNVVVKLGGMMMRLAAFDYLHASVPPTSAQLAAAWQRYVETSIQLFGPQRCLFESNFPVEKMGTGYRTFWNAMKRITAGANADEKAALYAGTARRVYRLD